MDLEQIFRNFDERRTRADEELEAARKARNVRKAKFGEIISTTVVPFSNKLISLAQQRRITVMAYDESTKAKEPSYIIRFEACPGVPTLTKEDSIEIAISASDDFTSIKCVPRYGAFDRETYIGDSKPLSTVTAAEIDAILKKWAVDATEMLGEAKG